MAHKRFDPTGSHFSRGLISKNNKGKFEYSVHKYMPPREWKLYVLHRASRDFGCPIHWLGGVALDHNINWLLDRKLVTKAKYHWRNSNRWDDKGKLRNPPDLNIDVLHITEKGKK